MWDSEIDKAARALTAGEPGGDLKARVLARIDAGGQRPRVRAWIKIAVPVAVLAGAVVLHKVHGVQGVHGVHIQGVHEVQGVQEVHKVQESPVPPARLARTSSAVEPAGRMASVDAGNGPRSGSNLSLAPIEVVPLVIAAPVVEDIPPAAPIAIDAIAISPIEVPAYDAAPEELAQ
jgi:hypothetical protein